MSGTTACATPLRRRSSGRSPGARPDALDAQEFWALRDVSFEVKPGEALGIIGPNGAGKSTALKLLTKILRPTAGRCQVRGRVGALIEIAAGFHPDLTGRENLYLQGAIMGMKRAEVTAKLDDIIDFSGIRDFIDTPVKRYSSGMNARLGFAIAAHVDPDVLLIDEVLAVGDFAFQQKCYERLAAVPRVGRGHRVRVAQHAGDRQPVRSRVAAEAEPVAHHRQRVGSRGALRLDRHRRQRSAHHRSRFHRAAAWRRRGAVGAGVARRAVDGRRRNRSQHPAAACNIGLEVVRNDGLTMFNGSPMIDGRPPIDLEPGTVIRARIHFRANVLRGTYRIMLHLADATKTWPMISVSGLASFVVHETTRVAGCAELEPSYDFEVEHVKLMLPTSA